MHRFTSLARRGPLSRVVGVGLLVGAALLPAVSRPPAAAAATSLPANLPESPPVPPACGGNPAVPDCAEGMLVTLDEARTAIGLPPYEVPAAFDRLPSEQQIFELSNLDRIDAGLPPAQALDVSMVQTALAAAQSNQEPPLPTTVDGGTVQASGGSLAIGYLSPLDAYYQWMYADGPGGANRACTAAGQPACWDHRRVVLTDYGGTAQLAGAATSGHTTTELLAGVSNPGGGSAELTWTGAQEFGAGRPAPVVAGIGPSWGVAGSTISLSGFNLAGGSVSFGGAPAASSCSATGCSATVPAGGGAVDITVTTPNGTSATWSNDVFHYGSGGYWIADAAGQVFAFGAARGFGNPPPGIPVASVVATPDHAGYWVANAAGSVWGFGDARPLGSGAGLPAPAVGMARTPDGGGYWLVTSQGGILTFGDAVQHGSTLGLPLKAPIVGIAATPDGGGYWLVASDGGIFAFGDAVFRGSTGALRLRAPVVGMAATSDGGGYWLVASDGGIFAFGDAVFRGSTGAMTLAAPVVGMAATRDGGGYWLVGADGGVFNFGDAPFFGSAAGATAARAVSVAAS